MAGRGGARPGAGRPAKKNKHARPIARAEKRIADRLPGLVDKLFDLAEGAVVLDPLDVEKVRTNLMQHIDDPESLEQIIGKLKQVYVRAPSFKALEYLLNRIMGKPVEKQEHSGENGGKIPLDIEISFGGGETDAAESPD
ncbi:MAG TPA: hypothetical protein VM223_07850 [Planctomycetota bacterium]|nr:hypothetical protein [Planctomycetota bacterium]